MRALQEYGLSLNEVKALLSLYRLGEASARQLHLATGIDRAETYRVLQSLQTKGIVVAAVSKPTKYRPVPIERALDLLIEEKKSLVKRLEAERKGIEKVLSEIRPVEAGIREPNRFEIIRGGKGSYQVIMGILNDPARCREEGLWVVTVHGAHRLLAYLDTIRAARRRGVKFRYLLPISLENAEPVKKLMRTGEVRHAAEMPARVFVADRSEVVEVYRPRDTADVFDPQEIGIWTNSEQIAQTISQMIEAIWAKSKDAGEVLKGLRGLL